MQTVYNTVPNLRADYDNIITRDHILAGRMRYQDEATAARRPVRIRKNLFTIRHQYLARHPEQA